MNEFLFTNIEEEKILAAFEFNKTVLGATQPKLHSMFCALFLKIVLSAAELMWFGQLGKQAKLSQLRHRKPSRMH